MSRRGLKRKLAVLELLFDSSDESDGELQIHALLEKQEDRKVTNFVELLNSFSDEKFRQHLRVSRSSFKKLVIMFYESQFMPKTVVGRPKVSAEKHMLIFLWFAGTKQVGRTVSVVLNVTLSSFHRILTRVINFFYEIAPQHIKMPLTPQSKLEISEKFQRISNFPNVIGCIDGSYIPIQTPVHKLKVTYVNRHHQTAITLQGVCDSECKFLDVITGFSSKIHDSRVFKLSFIYQKMNEICGPNYRYHLLGDSAYALSATLLKPFTDTGNLSVNQKKFNKCLSQTRVKIENAFGKLKGRFRQLIRLDFHTVEKASFFVIARCVLHNICIDWKEEDFEAQDDEHRIDQNQINVVGTTAHDKKIGEAKRNLLVNTLFL